MEINPKLLNPSGKRKLKKLLSEFGTPNYGCLSWADFVKPEDYYSFLSSWNTHLVLREIFKESGVEEDDEYDGGWSGLSYTERAIYENIANILIELRYKVDSVESAVSNVAERLDHI